MTALAVSAASVRSGMLEPTLDAQAANDEQDALILNLSPERDSIVEHLRALRALALGAAAGELLDAVERDVVLLARSNRIERDLERQVAGAADTASRDLRRAELSSGRGRTGGRRLLLAALAPYLDLLVTAGPELRDKLEVAAAAGGILATAGTSALTSTDFRRRLGAARYDVLLQLLDARDRPAEVVL